VVWIWKHIKYGVKCQTIENKQIRCRTKGGAKKIMTERQWIQIPQTLRKLLLAKTPDSTT